MPSYSQYKRQITVLDAKEDNIQWITVRGNHIPIKEGQTKEEAVKSFLEKKGGEERKLSNGGSTIGLTKKEHNKIEKHNEKVGKIAEQYKEEGKKASEFISKLEKKDPSAVKKFVESVEKTWGKNSKEAQRAREKYGIKEESSKKWSGAWKPTAKQKQEAGFRLLEIGYNDVDFGKDLTKNRQNVLNAIKESGTENADYLANIVKNMPDNSFADAEKFRTGVKSAKKDFSEGSDIPKSENKEQMPTSYQIEEAFREVGLKHKWEHVKYRLDMHGIDQYTVKEFINSGLFHPEDIIEALESPRHDKIDNMVKKLKKGK